MSNLDHEVRMIKTEAVREFVKGALDMVPDYFWKVPASSTGKYHPKYSLGEGGLVRHTQCVVYIALELFNIDRYNYPQNIKDCIIAALILHDTFKHGAVDELGRYDQYSVTEHPLIASDFVRSLENSEGAEYRFFIADLIKTHMGQWTQDYRTKKEILPHPTTAMQDFVHLCDYLASRKELTYERARYE